MPLRRLLVCWYTFHMALILALTGEKLAGKDTVAEHLKQAYGAVHFRHSQILDEILDILDLPISRRNEIDLGMGLRRVFGEGILNAAIVKKVRQASNPLIVVGGFRFPDEMKNVQALGAKTVYVTAPENVRYQRYLARREKSDDAQQTLEQFRQQEQEPTEIGIPALGAQADYKLENVGSLDELFAKVKDILASEKFSL